MLLRTIAEAIGKGLVAGLAGTAAMTLSSTIEMKLRGRPSSDAPAEAAAKVLGVEPAGEQGKEQFANIVHWGYGTAWGAVRGLLAEAGLRGAAGCAAHFGLVWGTALTMLPALGVAPRVSEWGAEEIAVDGLHHAVYAATAGAVYDWLDEE